MRPSPPRSQAPDICGHGAASSSRCTAGKSRWPFCQLRARRVSDTRAESLLRLIYQPRKHLSRNVRPTHDRLLAPTTGLKWQISRGVSSICPPVYAVEMGKRRVPYSSLAVVPGGTWVKLERRVAMEWWSFPLSIIVRDDAEIGLSR